MGYITYNLYNIIPNLQIFLMIELHTSMQMPNSS